MWLKGSFYFISINFLSVFQIRWFLLADLQIHWVFHYFSSAMKPIQWNFQKMSYFSILKVEFVSSLCLLFYCWDRLFLNLLKSVHSWLLQHFCDSCLKNIVRKLQNLCLFSVGICCSHFLTWVEIFPLTWYDE